MGGYLSNPTVVHRVHLSYLRVYNSVYAHLASLGVNNGVYVLPASLGVRTVFNVPSQPPRVCENSGVHALPASPVCEKGVHNGEICGPWAGLGAQTVNNSV